MRRMSLDYIRRFEQEDNRVAKLARMLDVRHDQLPAIVDSLGARLDYYWDTDLVLRFKMLTGVTFDTAPIPKTYGPSYRYVFLQTRPAWDLACRMKITVKKLKELT
jgi:hypothetical protein